MINIIAIFLSLGMGILGAVINLDFGLNIPDLGAILSITTMGSVILYSLNRNKKDRK